MKLHIEDLRNPYGSCFRAHYYRDQHGRPVRRTRDEYPYSYDPYVLYQAHDWSEQEPGYFCVYDDRMRQWDYKAYDRASKHLKGTGGFKSHDATTKFMSDYYDAPCRVTLVMEGANYATGDPYWVIGFINEKEQALKAQQQASKADASAPC